MGNDLDSTRVKFKMTRLESFLKMTRLGLESRNLPFNVCAGKKFLEVDFGASPEKNWRLKKAMLGANAGMGRNGAMSKGRVSQVNKHFEKLM